MIAFLYLLSLFLLEKVRLADLLHDPVHRKGFTLAVIVMLAQPLSGINAASFHDQVILSTNVTVTLTMTQRKKKLNTAELRNVLG